MLLFNRKKTLDASQESEFSIHQSDGYLAGQLLVSEAGGIVEDQNADHMIREGGRVIVGAPQVFEELQAIANGAWGG